MFINRAVSTKSDVCLTPRSAPSLTTLTAPTLFVFDKYTAIVSHELAGSGRKMTTSCRRYIVSHEFLEQGSTVLICEVGNFDLPHPVPKRFSGACRSLSGLSAFRASTWACGSDRGTRLLNSASGTISAVRIHIWRSHAAMAHCAIFLSTTRH